MPRLKKCLIRLSKDTRLNFRRVTVGSMIFFGGAAMLLWAEGSTHLTLLRQELIALLAIIMMVLGGSVGLLGYLGLSVFRIFRFLNTEEISDHSTSDRLKQQPSNTSKTRPNTSKTQRDSRSSDYEP